MNECKLNQKHTNQSNKKLQTNENKTNFNNNEKHIANTIQNNNKIKKHSKQHKTKINVSLTKKTQINRTQKTKPRKQQQWKNIWQTLQNNTKRIIAGPNSI